MRSVPEETAPTEGAFATSVALPDAIGTSRKGEPSMSDTFAAVAAKLKEDPSLHDKLKGAKSIDEAVTVLKSAGVDTSKADFIRSQARAVLELSDAELEAKPVGFEYTTDTYSGCWTWVAQCCP